VSGQSTTLIHALPLDVAVAFRDAFLSGAVPAAVLNDDPIGLSASSRNNFNETSLRALIRSAGVAGLGHLERLADFPTDKPEGIEIPPVDHAFVLSGAELQIAADGVRALQSALSADVDIVRRAIPCLADMDDAALAHEIDASPDKRRRQLDEMNRKGRGAEFPVRPHRYSLMGSDGALYETTLFLVAYLDVLEAAMAQGLAVVLVCWLY